MLRQNSTAMRLGGKHLLGDTRVAVCETQRFGQIPRVKEQEMAACCHPSLSHVVVGDAHMAPRKAQWAS